MEQRCEEETKIKAWRDKDEEKDKGKNNKRESEQNKPSPPHHTTYLCVQRYKIIRVHDRVNESVQHDCEVDIPIIPHIQIQPVKEEDAKMVIHVQKRQLLVAFLENNEDCIHEIEDFREVEYVEDEGDGWLQVIEGVARL